RRHCARGAARRAPDRADPNGVPAARAVHAQPAPGAVAVSDPRARLGLRLRPRVELARRVRRIPASEAGGGWRAAAHPHGARRGIRIEKPMRRLHLPTSLGARLSLAAATAVAVAVALASVTAYFAVRAKLVGEVDQALQSRADVVDSVRGFLFRVPPGALGQVLPPPAFGGAG